MCRKSKVQIFAAQSEIGERYNTRAYAETEYNGKRVVAVGYDIANAVTNLGYLMQEENERVAKEQIEANAKVAAHYDGEELAIKPATSASEGF